MAINATIQVRRGLLKDFDPTKMLPGEWAVSIDASTSNQIVWMCFAPGVCKRMGTYEDFQNMVYNATGQIIERYEDAFGSILEEVNTNAEAVSANTDIVLVAKSDIINTYLPQIKSYVSDASASASNAKTYSENAKASASEADKSAEDAKKYSQNAFSTTPEGYEVLVGDVDLLKNSIIQTTDRTLYGSKEGGIKLIGIGGASEQGENPSPDNPQEIESVGDSGSLGIKAEGKNWLIPKLGGSGFKGTSYTNQGVTATILDDGGIHISGTSTANMNIGLALKEPLNKGNVVYIYGVMADGTSMAVRFYDKNNNAYDSYGSGYCTVGVETATELTTRVVSGGTYDFVIYMMVSEVETDYEPYRSKSITIPLNEPLRGIGEVKDEIICQDGVWGINRGATKKYIGQQGWLTNSGWRSNAFYVQGFFTDGVVIDGFDTIADIMSEHFTVAKPSDIALTSSSVKSAIGYGGGSNLSLYIVVDGIENTDDLNAWIAENNPYVIYPLATPIFEPFTDQTPFYGLESFDTVTYISTDSEVEPSIELKFAKTEGDAVTLLNYNQTNLNRIAIAELTSAVLALNQE